MGFKFELGDQVKDKVTGFSGTVVGRCDHLSGCNTYGVQPRSEKAHECHETKWFDEPRLEAAKGKRLTVDEREFRTGADSVPQRTR